MDTCGYRVQDALLYLEGDGLDSSSRGYDSHHVERFFMPIRIERVDVSNGPSASKFPFVRRQLGCRVRSGNWQTS